MVPLTFGRMKIPTLSQKVPSPHPPLRLPSYFPKCYSIHILYTRIIYFLTPTHNLKDYSNNVFYYSKQGFNDSIVFISRTERFIVVFFNFVKVYPYFQAITPGMQWVLCNLFYDSLLFGANSIYELEFAKIYIWRPPTPNALHMLGSFPINFPYSLKRYTLPLIEHRTYS